MSESNADFSLLCRIGTRLCALPLQHVLETLRPLALARIVGAPDHVMGVSLIRGIAQPVVNIARLLGENDAQVTRYVSLSVDGRRVALAVSEVLGTRALPRETLQCLPPLLRHAGEQAIAALGELDAELLLVLDSARLLPAELLEEAAAPTEPDEETSQADDGARQAATAEARP